MDKNPGEKFIPLIRKDYLPAVRIFKIRNPDIPSGSVYFFTTDRGLTYEVTFGKKKNNYLGNVMNFSVISDEYEDEYSETNQGNVFSIIATIIEIIRRYHSLHPRSVSYEFSGEYKDQRDQDKASIRTRLYLRSARLVVDHQYWDLKLNDNKLILTRKIPT